MQSFATQSIRFLQFSEVEEFLRTEDFPVVLKPTDSAGSDGVKLCHNFEEAKAHFDHLLVVEAVNGGYNTEVLCQEFLRGKEYVVDTVSRDGEHKIMQVWVYDKRPANGAGEIVHGHCFLTQQWLFFLNTFYVIIAFVYFGMLPIDSSSQEAKLLINYCKHVLDALQIKNGPGHAEIILTPSGPCLVEMNCRGRCLTLT